MNWFVSFLFATLRPALGLIILAGLLIYSVFKKRLPKEKFLKLSFYIFSGTIILQSILFTILNWWLWSQQGITQQLLPPHSPVNYVLKYSWQHYWFESIITIFAATFVFFGIYFLNKKFEKNIFYNEEKYLAGLGILATGWPNCLIFLCLVLFLGIFFHLIFLCFNVNKMRGREDTVQLFEPFRLSFLYFWLPCALLILLLSDIINRYILINQLNI